jgi:hypothetical protein
MIGKFILKRLNTLNDSLKFVKNVSFLWRPGEGRTCVSHFAAGDGFSTTCCFVVFSCQNICPFRHERLIIKIKLWIYSIDEALLILNNCWRAPVTYPLCGVAFHCACPTNISVYQQMVATATCFAIFWCYRQCYSMVVNSLQYLMNLVYYGNPCRVTSYLLKV